MGMTIEAPAAMAAGASEEARPGAVLVTKRGGRERGDGSDGLTNVERDILDADDLGWGSDQIARQLGIKHDRVTRVLRTYRETSAERASYSDARRGCDQLLRAQLATGQHWLPPAIAAALIVALRVQPAARP